MMIQIGLAALAAFGSWLIPFLLLGGWSGRAIGRWLAQQVPPKQDHLPPHLVRWVPLALGIWVGVMNGLHAGIPAAVIAGGDAWSRQDHHGKETRTFPSTVGWGQATDSLVGMVTPMNILGLITLKLTVGGAIQPLRSAWTVGDAMQHVPGDIGDPVRWRGIWWKARPGLTLQSRIGVLSAAGLSALYLCALAGMTMVVVRLAHRDLRRPSDTSPSSRFLDKPPRSSRGSSHTGPVLPADTPARRTPSINQEEPREPSSSLVPGPPWDPQGRE